MGGFMSSISTSLGSLNAEGIQRIEGELLKALGILEKVVRWQKETLEKLDEVYEELDIGLENAGS
jgi:hypothetical protein